MSKPKGVPVESLDYWNLRAETFGAQCGNAQSKASYMARLIDKLALEEGQSVFDIGCASGTLAIPLARTGHPVCARDFSPRMIEKLQERAAAESLVIDSAVMAWEDDWEAFGITENSYDVAVASRSLMFKDAGPAESLAKLDRVARVKAAVTVAASPAPAFDKQLLEHLGREVPPSRNHIKVIAALTDMGRHPKLDYIPFERPMRFTDKEMAYYELRRLAGPQEFDEREEELFQRYADEHFMVEQQGDETIYQLNYRIPIDWAYIEWSTTDTQD